MNYGTNFATSKRQPKRIPKSRNTEVSDCSAVTDRGLKRLHRVQLWHCAPWGFDYLGINHFQLQSSSSSSSRSSQPYSAVPRAYTPSPAVKSVVPQHAPELVEGGGAGLDHVGGFLQQLVGGTVINPLTLIAENTREGLKSGRVERAVGLAGTRLTRTLAI